MYLLFFVSLFNLCTRNRANLTFKLESQIYLAAVIKVGKHEKTAAR